MKKNNFQRVIRYLPSHQKKTAAVIAAFTVAEIKKNKKIIKLEGIAYTMTHDCEKKNKI